MRLYYHYAAHASSWPVVIGQSQPPLHPLHPLHPFHVCEGVDRDGHRAWLYLYPSGHHSLTFLSLFLLRLLPDLVEHACNGPPEWSINVRRAALAKGFAYTICLAVQHQPCLYIPSTT